MWQIRNTAHSYISKQQSKFTSEREKKMSAGQVIVMLDFVWKLCIYRPYMSRKLSVLIIANAQYFLLTTKIKKTLI